MSLGDEMQALLLLSSLPDSWETLVVSLSNSAPNGKLTMSMVNDALFNEEARRKDVDKDHSHVLVTENRERQQGGNRGSGEAEAKVEADPQMEESLLTSVTIVAWRAT